MMAFGQAWNTFSVPATAVSIFSIAVMVFCLKYARKIPGAILVTFGATAAVFFLHLSVETIGTRFGESPAACEIGVRISTTNVFRQAPVISIHRGDAGGHRVAMSAVVSDRRAMTSTIRRGIDRPGHCKYRFTAVWWAPATGAIARTATNVRSGAKTPVAGIIHALTLLATFCLPRPWCRTFPCLLCCHFDDRGLNMGDWEEIPEILKLRQGGTSPSGC